MYIMPAWQRISNIHRGDFRLASPIVVIPAKARISSGEGDADRTRPQLSLG